VIGLTAEGYAVLIFQRCRDATTDFVLYETSERASRTHHQISFLVSDLETVVRRLQAQGVVFTGDIAEDERTEAHGSGTARTTS